MSPLLADLDAVTAGSTAPSSSVAALRAFVEQALQGQQGRAEHATRVNEERRAKSDEVRGRIRAVVGVLPLTTPLEQLVDAIEKRLKAKGQGASRWRIADEVRQLRKEASDTVLPPRYFATTLRAGSVEEHAHGDEG